MPENSFSIVIYKTDEVCKLQTYGVYKTDETSSKCSHFNVDVKHSKCDCYQWGEVGVPCMHVIEGIIIDIITYSIFDNVVIKITESKYIIFDTISNLIYHIWYIIDKNLSTH